MPDEHYEIQLWYFDRDRLIEDRKAYDARIKNFEQDVQHLWDLIEVMYRDSKSVFKVNDFEDLAKKNKSRIRDLLKHTGGEGAQEMPAEPVSVRFARMHERIKNMYEFLYPVERRIMEDRLAWLERENSRLDFMINPYHLQPGILLDVDITSIKRKKVTLDAMANVLNEFLHGVSKGFQDAAFASFSRRRSTVREDINQSFSSVVEEEEHVAVAAAAPKPRAIAAPSKAAPKKKPGVVDSKAKAKKPSRSGSQLTEI